MDGVARIHREPPQFDFTARNRADDRPPLVAAVTAREQMIFSSERDGTNRPFDGIGVEFDAAVIEDARQAFSSRERVANGSASVLRPDIWESCASSHSRKASIVGLEKDRRSARRCADDSPRTRASIA